MSNELANSINEIIQDLQSNPGTSVDEKIYIDIEDILDNFGEIFVYADIVSRKHGFGSLARVYTVLVHPVIVDLFNDAVNGDDDAMEENLREMVNVRSNDSVADFVYDSLEARIMEYVSNPNNRHITVATGHVIRLAISMVELLVGHIRSIALDFRDRVRDQLGDGSGYVMLETTTTASLEPPTETPTLLSVIITYRWISV